MIQEKTNLTAFTLKLSDDNKQLMKLICAVDKSFNHQYQLCDEAVIWAVQNKKKLVAIANTKNGSNRTYYVSESKVQLNILEEQWNCNTTRALYTAVVQYLQHREIEVSDILVLV